MTLRLGRRWMLFTASYKPTQRKPYPFRLYIGLRQIEIGIGERGYTAALVKRDATAPTRVVKA